MRSVGARLRGAAGGASAPEGARVDELAARALAASHVCVTISDPRLPDNPLVWVNPAFERMTGYRRDELLGRNCRFLQGAATDADAVRRVHAAMVAGVAVQAELLNYRADGTPFWNSLAISPVLDGDGRLTHYVGVQTDVTERVLAAAEHDRLLTAEREARSGAEQARAQLALIERVGTVLSETLDSADAFARVVSAIVPALADYCAVDLVDGAGRVAVAHREPDQAALLVQLAELVRDHPGASPVPTALRTGSSVLIGAGTPQAHDDPPADMLEILRRLQTRSGAVVPMRARGRVIGALTVAMTAPSGREFGSDELALTEILAARAALAVDNARLFEAESAQRRRADALAAAGEMLAASLLSTEVLSVLLDRLVPAFADWAFVHVDERSTPTPRQRADTAPSMRVAASRHADPELARRSARFLETFEVRADQPGPGAVWATNCAQLIASVDDALRTNESFDSAERAAIRAIGVSTVISVPLTARSITFGALTLVRHAGAAFTRDELDFVAELGRRGALALENARLYEAERDVALELQRSLLPAQLPLLPSLEVAGRYLAGAAGAEVGGDWYDVIPLPDGRVTVAVGDVMGRGVPAAAVMGQLRAALRSYALEGLHPAPILRRMAKFTAALDGEHFVTCLVGLHDPDTATLYLASAGHPPPLLLGGPGRGGATFVELDPGLPLGVPRAGHDLGETTLPLALGSALLMFTDGLVEDRDTPVGDGMHRLAAAFGGPPGAGVPPSADDLCGAALRAMGRDLSHDDDTAVLVLRAVQPPERSDRAHPTQPFTPAEPDEPLDPAVGQGEQVRIGLDARPEAAAFARGRVREVLVRHGMVARADTAVLLVSELVTNALRHGDGPRELVVRCDDDGATVTVGDRSSASPRPRRPVHDELRGSDQEREAGWDQAWEELDVLAESGRGLLLVDALADIWGWQQTARGKRVWFRLYRSTASDD